MSKLSNNPWSRRHFLQASGALLGASLAGCASTGQRGVAQVVVVGGGFAGATCARYLRMWSDNRIDVTLVERDADFVSCPMSNLVVGGVRRIEDITLSRENLARRHGVRLLRGEVAAIDLDKRQVRLRTDERIPFDRVVVAPGIDFLWDSVPGLSAGMADSTVFHAWKAGTQTTRLHEQIRSMPDGGTVALCIPKAPYRCPPGPYERASTIAHYLKTHKPRSKVLILDANDDIQSKKGLFLKAWADYYPGMIEYRKDHVISSVDPNSKTVRFELGETVRAEVLNVIPAQRAGDIARPFINKNGRWVGVNWLSMEAEVAPGVHVLGDATFSAPGMPKSGHMANQHAKVAAAAIINLLGGLAVNDQPVVMNTCYSFVTDRSAMHVASVHQYDAGERTFKTVAGSGGLSPMASDREGDIALAWARNIWADVLG